MMKGGLIRWKDKKTSKNPEVELKAICRRGELIPLAEEYIEECKLQSAEQRAQGNKGYERFPNLAGFARRLNVGVSTLKKIEGKWPAQYGLLLALFEDEALNSDKSATILNAYMKEHLGFGEKKEGDAIIPVGDVKVLFEHDLEKDGKWESCVQSK